MGLTGLFAAFVSLGVPEPAATFLAGEPVVSCAHALPTKRERPVAKIIMCFERMFLILYVCGFATRQCRRRKCRAVRLVPAAPVPAPFLIRPQVFPLGVILLLHVRRCPDLFSHLKRKAGAIANLMTPQVYRETATDKCPRTESIEGHGGVGSRVSCSRRDTSNGFTSSPVVAPLSGSVERYPEILPS